jgi:C-terminal processing protease CtpA/Prc
MCISAGETFVSMMSGAANVTIMGDRTCGSSGNTQTIHLPLGMTVGVPAWIDYLPNGQPLDDRGFEPQIFFAPTPGAFEGKRDDLLAAALKRLHKAADGQSAGKEMR